MVFALYKSGDSYKVFTNERGDSSPKLVFNELASDTIDAWTFIFAYDTMDELAQAMSDYLSMPIMKVADFLHNYARVTPKDFGTYKQWRAIAYINDRDGKNHNPQTYEELKNILETELSQ